MDRPTLIQACLNGARPPAAHSALPITPEQIADDVHAVVLAGADAVHVHPKDDDGLDALDPDTIDAVVTAVKVIAPGLPISLTTGAWALPDPQARVDAIHAWGVLPDVASVNWHEVGSVAVVEALLEREIGVEVGLWTIEDVRDWATSCLRDDMRRVLIELPDGLGDDEIMKMAHVMVGGVRAVAPNMPILLHGEGRSAWPALHQALSLGLQTRIGLEDTLHLPDGEPAPDNASLVRTARELADRLG